MEPLKLCITTAAECAPWLENRSGLKVTGQGRAGLFFYYQVLLGVKGADDLLDILYEFMLHQNPIFRQSQRLRQAAEQVFMRTRHNNMQQLKTFINENNTLNLEGYIQFRLYEQNIALNLMLYSLAKRIRAGE